MYPNNPNDPSNIPGLTNGQATGLLYGMSGLFPGLGSAGVGLGVFIYNTFGGGSGGASSSSRKHDGVTVVHVN